jgi:hypothetical protein
MWFDMNVRYVALVLFLFCLFSCYFLFSVFCFLFSVFVCFSGVFLLDDDVGEGY